MITTKFCFACASSLDVRAEICPKCGVRQPGNWGGVDQNTNNKNSDKKVAPALLLGFFLGWLGMHRFYVGRTGSGILMIISFFSVIGTPILVIWVIIDLIRILFGTFEDSKGKPLVDWS